LLTLGAGRFVALALTITCVANRIASRGDFWGLMMAVICPTCGQEAATVKTRYGIRNKCCDLWSWGDKPLVDSATHQARQAAHASFDTLWKQNIVKRSAAYHLLALELGIPGAECHFSMMGIDRLRLVPDAVYRIYEKLRQAELQAPTINRCDCGNLLSKKRQVLGITKCPTCTTCQGGESGGLI
jgi:hypothetical protein